MKQSLETLSASNANKVAVGVPTPGPYYWVGSCDNGLEYFAGQTFTSPVQGNLESIKLFASMVYGQTEAHLSIFELDAQNNTFTKKLAEETQMVSKQQQGDWVVFTFKNLIVNSTGKYGFKLSCNHNGMMAVAECPWKTFNHYKDGAEWTGSSVDKQGRFHHDFDLAFEAIITRGV